MMTNTAIFKPAGGFMRATCVSVSTVKTGRKQNWRPTKDDLRELKAAADRAYEDSKQLQDPETWVRVV
jgi:hypothetical protein